MAQTRFTCILTRADEPSCQSYARVTIVDAEAGEPAPAHVLATPSPRSTELPAPTSTGPTPRASMNGSAKPLRHCP